MGARRKCLKDLKDLRTSLPSVQKNEEVCQSTYLSHEGEKVLRSYRSYNQPISRVAGGSPVLTVDEATQDDFRFFCEHPELDEYIREFCPGEFGECELPEIPPGFRYATHISVTLRVGGQPVGRYRQLMAICEDLNELEE